MFKKISILIVVFLLPGVLFAADISSLIKSVGGWIDDFAKIVFVAVIAAFFWGLFLFVLGGESKRDEGKSMMIWGIIAIFVMTSIWGIVAIFQDSAGITKTGFEDNKLDVQSMLPK